MVFKLIPYLLAVTVNPFPFKPARRIDGNSIYVGGYLFGVHTFYTRRR